MHKIYFTVGPSQIYPTVPKHIQAALKEDVMSMNHRGPIFEALFRETTDNLRKLLGIPKTSQIFFLSSALEGMERIIQNCVYKESLHIITGAFSKKFYQTALDYKKTATLYNVILASTTRPESSKAHDSGGTNVSQNDNLFSGIKIPKDAELVGLTENETSTGFEIPMEQIYALKDLYPKKLIAIDIVSSVPFPKIDFNKIDLAFFSVQKGFGLPAGLGILVVNQAAMEKAKWIKKAFDSSRSGPTGGSIGSHHSIPSLLEKAQIGQTPATPNVLNIYLLNKVTKDMLIRGVRAIRGEINQKAKLFYDFFDKRADLTPTVSDPKYRSKTTIVVNTFGKTKQIIEKLAKKGFIISKGYGDHQEDQIRIANFPAHTLKDVKDLLKAI